MSVVPTGLIFHYYNFLPMLGAFGTIENVLLNAFLFINEFLLKLDLVL